ncbi:helix-turn-helix domain-containing protein [Ornithinibacillus halotolerans]|uniref:HTH cro/C1-type domain-containing protein n=1 Tax=Ornithinibacillus halotolerans TaxID=1274357 RepID=A0A916SCY5_9BACI|nr:helix-turn-helix transcriptional regulator [Ornithinibacillus halotolerans]GGA91599.1 hypothetical protein GCM10008025_37620 [Ornithinibacillus halotolerans]
MEKVHKEILKKIIGGELKRFRENEIDMTQEEFSEITGLGPKHIGDIENGKKEIQIDTIFKLYNAGFDVNKAYEKVKKEFKDKGIDITKK